MNKHDNFVGLLGVAFGLVGFGYAMGAHSKMAKISEKLERSIDDLAGNTPIDIPNDMIERAVEKAVALEAKQAVSKATDAAIVAVKRDIHKQVTDAVESEYSDMYIPHKYQNEDIHPHYSQEAILQGLRAACPRICHLFSYLSEI